ncbi:CoA transferase [Gordonia sp. TBRC 11910]|uniref:CoA transferase n=1 Tax=Gordonia asplenii TaxID=2725283 RepID=A0A848KXS6_9ACTN|nr:CoA transferase [Gordonia asplenii]NMO02917.1 CoA transferase [Gordonia asplenii]
MPFGTTHSTESSPLPLAGIRVLDCTRYLPFSYGSQLLVNLGADVIKVEPPGGEDGRAMRTTFDAVNAGKDSLTIDFRTAADAARFLGMVDDVDVVYESFRPGVMAGFGLAPKQLLERNPALIVCSATGYGQSGPYAQRPGHDLNYLAVAGALVSHTDRGPILPGFPVADMSAGVFAALSITAAVLSTMRTGIGQHIDLSMCDVALSMNMFSVASGLGGSAGLPWPQITVGDCPCYGVWQTSDGQWIALGNIEPKFWRNFLDEIGLPQYRDDALVTGTRARHIRAEIAEVINKDTAARWDARLSAIDVCYSPVNDMSAVGTDAQVRHRGFLRELDSTWTVAFPVNFSGFEPKFFSDVPVAGQSDISQ